MIKRNQKINNLCQLYTAKNFAILSNIISLLQYKLNKDLLYYVYKVLIIKPTIR